MEILKFTDIEDLYLFMCDMVDNDSKNITAVLFYDEALELMRYFLEDYDIEVGHIEIGTHDYNGYDREYYVSIGSDYTLDVCPAMPNYDKKFGYVPVQEADIILYSGDAKQSIVKVNDCEESIQIEFDPYEDLCGDCCYDCLSCPQGIDHVVQLIAEYLRNNT